MTDEETEVFELKPITKKAVKRALEKAEHYRLLNEPEQAESICLDVLEIDPKNQNALIVLVLALTDQFQSGGASRGARRASDYANQLQDDYARTYYPGLIHERQARAFLTGSMSRSFAYEGFRDAMDCYEKAAELRPADNDDAILRWNSCVRTIQRERLRPRADEGELPLE